jgi:hypothetical protein
VFLDAICLRLWCVCVCVLQVHDVITSIYAVTQEEALKVIRTHSKGRFCVYTLMCLLFQLAGLQVQVVYGDHNPTTHVPGFLTNNKDIANFIPIELYPQRKPAAWEEAILKGTFYLP